MLTGKTVITNIADEVEEKLLKGKLCKCSSTGGQQKIVLLTNDDGIEALGLKTLYAAFCKDKKYDVRIVAPDRERSAVGHAITVFDPISVKKEYIDGIFCGYSVDGTPADCVKLAITAIFEKKPDILISGINRGANVGENIIYSGTVSAATEGTIYNVHSIAVSLDSFRDTDYSFAAKFAKKMADLVLGLESLPARTLLNINIPDAEEKDIKGVKITHQGNVKFRDIFIKRVDPRGREYYWMDGEYEVSNSDKDSDFSALRDNFISVTPIQHDMTDYRHIEYFRGLLEV
ncbi:MAG: 5'/3'-nucleotidase SurE [Actinobacteria bacterium]|nr:5'/3'-nucleotidase SurE [Actinomycetota bacterium]